MLIERYQRLDELIKRNNLLQNAHNFKSMTSVNASADKVSAVRDGRRADDSNLPGSGHPSLIGLTQPINPYELNSEQRLKSGPGSIAWAGNGANSMMKNFGSMLRQLKGSNISQTGQSGAKEEQHESITTEPARAGMPEVMEYDNKNVRKESEPAIEEEIMERSQASRQNDAAHDSLVSRITMLENELAEAKQRLEIGSDLLQTLFK